MQKIYESFEELAETMTDGYGKLHIRNCPGENDCCAWQRGILDFAEWLDHIGLKVNISDKAANFYDFMNTREKAIAKFNS